MGILTNLFKKEEDNFEKLDVSDDDIVALADGEIIDIKKVSDPVFAEQMMGQSLAFKFPQEEVYLCSPANGTLTVMFPTGHAFGVTTNNDVGLLIHIGVDTVNSKGDGFKILKKQGDIVKAGDPIVRVDYEKLIKRYDMSTILIITNTNDKEFTFIEPCIVSRGQSVLKK